MEGADGVVGDSATINIPLLPTGQWDSRKEPQNREQYDPGAS